MLIPGFVEVIRQGRGRVELNGFDMLSAVLGNTVLLGFRRLPQSHLCKSTSQMQMSRTKGD